MGMEANNIVVPFVMKTYQMVNDPKTDSLISWGKANNSFVVTDPLNFSDRILPAYFKHNNFSSFVRQLNTYGFRKVDPDKWEFANQWFLRGRRQLLKNIVRRKHSKIDRSSNIIKSEDFDDEEIVMEIARLKQEQKTMEQELECMNKRLEATERRPQQMLSFLNKVVEDPDLLPRMVLQKEVRTKQLLNDKKPRLMLSSSSSSASSSAVAGSSSIRSETEEEGAVGVDFFFQSSASPGTTLAGRLGYGSYGWAAGPCPIPSVSAVEGIGNGVVALSPPGYSMADYGVDRVGQLSYFGEMAAGLEAMPPPPYPFSLLGRSDYC